MGYSHFDGGLLEFIFICLFGFFVTVISLGILLPWSVCLIYGWRINNTFIDGHQLHFSGSALSLFGHWLWWWFLTAITFGIYGFWVFIKVEQWKVENTSMLN